VTITPPEHQRTHTPVIQEKEFWLLIALGILCFYRPLFTSDTFYFRDLYLHFIPQKQLFVRIVHGGELPLWDPYLHGGQPFLGNVQNLALYPTNFLYLILPLMIAFNVDLVFHVILCAVGSYWFARRLGFQTYSAFIVGVLFGFSGYTLSLMNLMNRLLAMAYLPLILTCWHLFISERKGRWFALSVLCGVFQIFAGAPEMSMITFTFLFLWTLIYPYSQTVFKRVLWCVGLGAFVGTIGSVQLMPASEMIQQSSRASAGGYVAFAHWSLYPQRIPELSISNFFGSFDKVSRTAYWGGKSEDRGYPYILSIYLGALTIAFAIAGLFSRNSDPLPNKARYCLGFIFVGSIVFSMGRFLPAFDFFYKTAFFLNRFRYPIKILAAAVLPAALLTASSVEHYFAEPKSSYSKRVSFAFLIIAGAISTFVGVCLIVPNVFTAFLDFYFSQSENVIRTGLREAFLHLAAMWFAAALILIAARISPRNWHRWALAGLMALDLVYAGYSINWYVPKDFFAIQPTLVPLVKQDLKGGRFMRGIDPPNIVVKMPKNDISLLFRYYIETLYDYTGAFFQIPLIYHQDFDGLAKREIHRIAEQMYTVPWKDRSALLSVSGIKVILSPEPIDTPGANLAALIATPSNTRFYLYRYTRNAERIRFVSRARMAKDSEDAFKQLTDPHFDPGTEVILETPSNIRQPRLCQQAGSIQITALRLNSSSMHVEIPCEGYLVFSEPYYPGWEFTIDGKKTEALKANYAFTALAIDPGNHNVERKYRPEGFRNGLMVSLLSSTILVAMLTVWRHNRKVSSSQKSKDLENQ
jgi:Bacterial membrane protein YfhO